MPLICVELFRVEAKGQKYEFIALDAVSFFNIIITTSGRSTPSERGGGVQSSRPWDKGGPGLKKIFSALRVSFWSKNKVGEQAPQAPPLNLPLITSGKLSHCYFRPAFYLLLFNEGSVAKVWYNLYFNIIGNPHKIMITPILSKVNLTTVVHELLVNIKRNFFNVHYLVILSMIVHFIRVCTVPFGGY